MKSVHELLVRVLQESRDQGGVKVVVVDRFGKVFPIESLDYTDIQLDGEPEYGMSLNHNEPVVSLRIGASINNTKVG